MTINLTDYIFEMDRADTAEENLKLVTEKFRVFSETARCYLCEEKIGTERWRIGEYTSGNKEVVHQSCWDEEAERASSQESYWCGIEPEKDRQPPFGEGPCAQILFEGWLQAHNHGSRGGEPVRAPKTNPCADVLGSSTLEAFASSEGFSTYAREHGSGGGQCDAQGSWSPTHVAGCGGPVEVRVPERLIPFTGNNDVTVRVPRAVKAVLAAKVTDEQIIVGDEFIKPDKIARALKDKGIK